MSIVVIGSINIDLVTKANSFPKVGETIIGNSFHTFYGGKGSNQAVAASRLGEKVHFIGCVGNDINGIGAIDNLSKNNIDVESINILENETTGIAQITIAQEDNSIIIIKGANDFVDQKIIDDNLNLILNADLVLMQLEIPLKTVQYLVDICLKQNIKTVLNPAPAMVLTDDLINKVTYITPNETEYRVMFNEEYPLALKKFPNKLIVTRGDKGVEYFNGTKLITIPAQKVDVVDTTGAGDSFNGALCVGLIRDMPLYNAIEFANKVAAYSIRKLGAQTSMPYLKEVE